MDKMSVNKLSVNVSLIIRNNNNIYNTAFC